MSELIGMLCLTENKAQCIVLNTAFILIDGISYDILMFKGNNRLTWYLNLLLFEINIRK
jgi:hypothetical protein